jgi:hypothetical protein
VSFFVATIAAVSMSQPAMQTVNAVDDCAETFAEQSKAHGLQLLMSKGWALFGPQPPEAPSVLQRNDRPHMQLWYAAPESAAAKESGSAGGYCVVYRALLLDSDVWEIDQVLGKKYKKGDVVVGRDIVPPQPFAMRVTISPSKGAK